LNRLLRAQLFQVTIVLILDRYLSYKNQDMALEATPHRSCQGRPIGPPMASTLVFLGFGTRDLALLLPNSDSRLILIVVA